jgi:hypothetical protein
LLYRERGSCKNEFGQKRKTWSAARVARFRARRREAELEQERLVDWESITGEHWASLLPKELLALQAWRYDRAVYYDRGVRVVGGVFRPWRYKFPRPEHRYRAPIDRSGEPWAARLGGRRLGSGGLNKKGDRALTDYLGGRHDGRGAVYELAELRPDFENSGVMQLRGALDHVRVNDDVHLLRDIAKASRAEYDKSVQFALNRRRRLPTVARGN